MWNSFLNEWNTESWFSTFYQNVVESSFGRRNLTKVSKSPDWWDFGFYLVQDSRSRIHSLTSETRLTGRCCTGSAVQRSPRSIFHRRGNFEVSSKRTGQMKAWRRPCGKYLSRLARGEEGHKPLARVPLTFARALPLKDATRTFPSCSSGAHLGSSFASSPATMEISLENREIILLTNLFIYFYFVLIFISATNFSWTPRRFFLFSWQIYRSNCTKFLVCLRRIRFILSRFLKNF